MKGLDISTWQGYPNWNKVKGNTDFVIVKATQGRAESSNSYMFTDSKFKYNITGAAAVGIPCGTYHYLTAKTNAEAAKEARYFIDAMKPYKHLIKLYAAVDVESWHLNGLTKKQLTDIVDVFCREVESAGYLSIVYTNPDWLRNRLGDINRHRLWLALWRNVNNVPAGYGDMKIWQYGMTTVPGIYGHVDGNIGYFDIANPSGKPEPEPLPPTFIPTPVPSERDKIKAGDRVRVENPVNYDTGRKFRLYYPVYDVLQIKGDRAVVGIGKVVTAAVHVNYIERV